MTNGSSFMVASARTRRGDINAGASWRRGALSLLLQRASYGLCARRLGCRSIFLSPRRQQQRQQMPPRGESAAIAQMLPRSLFAMINGETRGALSPPQRRAARVAWCAISGGEPALAGDDIANILIWHLFAVCGAWLARASWRISSPIAAVLLLIICRIRQYHRVAGTRTCRWWRASGDGSNGICAQMA